MNTIQNSNDLNGQVAVITGGTGQVGYATAMRLAERGVKIVALVRRDLDQANLKMQKLPNFEKLQHFALLASVTDSLALTNAFNEIKKSIGRCDILINAAGITKNAKPENLNELTDEIFDDILKTNLRGTFSVIRTFAPLLKENGNGLIINLSSTASLRASNSNTAYACAKAGVNMMTQTLAKALAPEIRILAIAPGHMDTPTSGATKGVGVNETIAAATPLKRITHADDVASTIEACITNIRFATGTLLVIDGGRTL